MLSAEVTKKLNEQVAKEMFASNLYLSMSSWCFHNRLDGAGQFLFSHAGQESDHAKKLITYLNETDSVVELQAIEKPEIVTLKVCLMCLKKLINMSYQSQSLSTNL